MKNRNLIFEIVRMLQTRLYEEFYICYNGIILSDTYRITEDGLQMYISNFDGNKWVSCESNLLEKILIGEAYIYGYARY